MAATRIVETLDVVEHICPSVVAGRALLVWPIRLEIPVKDVRGDHRAFTNILRFPAPFGQCPQSIQPHQAFDPVKSARTTRPFSRCVLGGFPD